MNNLLLRLITLRLTLIVNCCAVRFNNEEDDRFSFIQTCCSECTDELSQKVSYSSQASDEQNISRSFMQLTSPKRRII